MFTRYQEFLLEQLLQESIVYFSPELRKKLKKIKSDLSKDLINLETRDIKDDISFFDIDKDGYLSYNTMKNASRLLQVEYPHLVDGLQNVVNKDLVDELYNRDKLGHEKASGIYTKSRNRIKFGRLINKLLPGKYSAAEIETFTNQWKSLLENVAEKFEEVSGEDIAYWYKAENYKELKHTLGGSCMRENNDDTFRIYTLNPEICKMLIITEGGDLVARAIVWKVTKKSEGNWEWFMDRQYTIADSYVNKMRDYAIAQGWAYKELNNHHTYKKVTWKVDEETLVTKTINMEVQLKSYRSAHNFDYGRYPYVDTFRRYDPSSGILYNDDEQKDGCYLLDDTGGGYTECESGVYSEWYDERIPEDQAVYSDAVDSYLWQDRAVQVRRGSRGRRGWYPEDHDDIVFDEYMDDYIHSDDSVYSDEYGHSILQDDATSTIYQLDSDGEPNRDESYVYADDDNYIDLYDFRNLLWYEKLSSEFRNWEDGYTHTRIKKRLLTKDYEGNWIPKILSMDAFSVIESPYEGVNYLSKTDARILDLEVDVADSILIDKYHYNQEIESIYPQLYTKCKEKIAEYEAQQKAGEDIANSIIQLTKERLEEIEDKKWIDWEVPEEE